MIGFAVAFHYWSLGTLLKFLPKECGPNRHFLHATASLLALVGLHLFIILCYALALWFSAEILDLGALGDKVSGSFMDYYYHSTVSYSTLGLSAIPEGHLKIMTALESLLGIILLTWSATFFYTVMGRSSQK